MQFIMFTKHLQGLNVDGMIAALKSAGMEGADLCVRSGYPVTPENAPKKLPEVAKQFAEEGLGIPLVTTPGEFITPDVAYAEALYAACAKARVTHIKLGYWHWKTEDGGYWGMVDRIRGYLEGFQALSKQYHVKTCIHTHSGEYMGLNSCAAIDLVRGFDPKCLGVFADPGHLSIVGEPIAMALDIVKDYLALLAFKDLMRQRIVRNGKAIWQIRVVRMGQGFVEWEDLVAALKKIVYDGAISFHSEYSGVPVETVIDLARIDVRFIRGLLAEVR
jgi:sugar phosphate isomerase/epimerase